MTRPCRKDDPNWMWPCSCDECARASAAAWMADMDRVRSGEITLDEAINEHIERVGIKEPS